VGRIERGERRTVRTATLARLADALGTSPDALVGGQGGENWSCGDAIGSLRRAVATTEATAGAGERHGVGRVPDRTALTAAARRAWRWYVDGRHDELLAALPGLLADARCCAAEARGQDGGPTQRLLSIAYRLAAGLAGRLSHHDLAWIGAERALEAAHRSDDPDVQSGAAIRYVSWILIRQGREDEAERLSVGTAERLEPRLRDRDPIRMAVFGNLLFNAATAAAAAGGRGRASDLLAVAQATALRVGRDTATETAIFGPRVAALQAVEQAVRLGDPEIALRLATQVPAVQGEVPAFWEAGHRLHLASAALAVRNDQMALVHLGAAHDLAPGWTACQRSGTATMRMLVDRATRRRGRAFARLANHYGVGSSLSSP